MIMCVLLCYPVSIQMSQLSTGRPISSIISRIFDSSYVLSCGHDFKFAV